MLSILLAGLLHIGQMGSLTFPVTGNAACKANFTDGMLALHSFMYERAEERFAAAWKADPRCKMALWGEAMTHSHPIWGEEDLPAAKKILAQIGDESGLTLEERAFIDSARALFGDGDINARQKAWAEKAERMHHDFPKDDEAALEYALSLIATTERADGMKKMMQAAALGLDVLARRPNHPGAAHYIIHACDSPDHAILALPAAERYAQIAPAASHALHMPSHIFVQLGMWERVARSNEASWAASQHESQGQTIDKYDWHAYSWLVAAYLELGQIARAEKLMKDLGERIAHEDNAEPRFAYSMLAHLFLTDADAWDRVDEVLRPISSHLPLESGEAAGSVGCAQHAPGGSGATRYPVGLISLERMRLMRAEAAMRRGDEAGVRAELDLLKPVYEAMHAWQGMMSPSWDERRKNHEAALIAVARFTHAHSDALLTAAVAALQKSAADADPFASGPAFDPPVEQRLGELYLAAGKPLPALAAFEAALAHHPRLSRALLGAARAAKAAGQPQLAATYYADLAALYSAADPDLPAAQEARLR